MKTWLINLLYIAIIVFIGTLTYSAFQVGSTAKRVRAAIDTIQPELQATLQETKLTVRELKSAAKAQRDQWETPEAVKATDQWRNVGYQLNGALGHVTYDLVPALTQTSNNLAKLIDDTNQQVNQKVLPQITQVLVDTSGEFKKYMDRLTYHTNKLMEAGTLSVQDANNAIQDARALLQDPAVLKTLQELAETSTEVKQTAKHFNQVSLSAEEAMAYAPPLAKDFQEFTHEQKKWNKVVILARILGYVF